MLCQQCQSNEANIQIIKSIDGKQTEEFLCEECAHEKEELDFTFEPQFSLHKLFSSMLNQGLLDDRDSMLASKNQQCPVCGLSFAQFSQVGRLGCKDCFMVFNENLKPLLKRIHASSTHNGKIPVRAQRRVKYKREIDQLKDALHLKVQNEEFEEAAVLRDKIKAMEKDLAAGLQQEENVTPGDAGNNERSGKNGSDEDNNNQKDDFDNDQRGEDNS